jgi:hypothetical protein
VSPHPESKYHSNLINSGSTRILVHLIITYVSNYAFECKTKSNLLDILYLLVSQGVHTID